MPTPEQSLPVIDWNLNAAVNPPDFLPELLTMFGKQIPDLQKKINSAYAKKEHQELVDLLHKLQGGCAYCNLVRLKATAAKFSTMLRNGEPAPKKFLDDVNIEIDAVMKE